MILRPLCRFPGMGERKLVGLGGLEPPTSPLSVVNRPLATGADGLRPDAIRQCLCGPCVGERLLRFTIVFDLGVHQNVHQLFQDHP